VPKPKDETQDRYAARPKDSVAGLAWRQRMATTEAQAIYKDRAATAECINALARNRGLRHLLVRGIAKVKACVLWYAVAHNVARALSLRASLAMAA
jgi:hypothetical protein